MTTIVSVVQTLKREILEAWYFELRRERDRLRDENERLKARIRNLEKWSAAHENSIRAI